MKQIFESKRIKYVEVTLELVNDYLEMINDYENVEKYIGKDTNTISLEDEIKWVNKKLEEKAVLFSMIEKETDEFIGSIELMDVNGETGELGIAITAKKQNQGFGKESIRAMIDYGFNVLNLNKITLRVFPYNPRAYHVYKQCGFKEYNRTNDDIYMEINKC